MNTKQFVEIKGESIRFLRLDKYEMLVYKSAIKKFALLESIGFDDCVLRLNDNCYIVSKEVGKTVYDFLAAKPKVKAYEVRLFTNAGNSYIVFVKPENFEYFVRNFVIEGSYQITILDITEVEEPQCWICS